MSPPATPVDLVDLRFLPAWANEPARPGDYANFEGEEAESTERRGEQRPRGRDRGSRPRSGTSREPRGRDSRPSRAGATRPARDHREREAPRPLAVTVRFLPRSAAFESVIVQIKSGMVAYSVFALARLFLEKPERYDVRLTTPEELPLFQLGEGGPVSSDRQILENGAFASARDDFYIVEVTQTEPLKGNFTNVARCRLSGTLLGPTNHHQYQPQLRTLYETRFSRRMSFQDYQRQVEIVSDPAVVEQWKEQARNVTTYVTKTGEPPTTFSSAAEAERHFRQNHLPGLLRSAPEVTINGVLSRRLPDRALGRAIEEAWAAETRSPSKMMQELAAGLRQAALNIFRHRRGMLFVSPVRSHLFLHERAGVSPTINAILEKVSATPGITRKQLAEQLTTDNAEAASHERAKMALASDLRWLVSEGYVIEFNDGSLDLPRTKPAAAPPIRENKTTGDQAAPESSPLADGATQSSAPDATQKDQEPKLDPSVEPVAIAEPSPTNTGDDGTGRGD